MEEKVANSQQDAELSYVEGKDDSFGDYGTL
jgi:hypothetical protein